MEVCRGVRDSRVYFGFRTYRVCLGFNWGLRVHVRSRACGFTVAA